jgi:hypothetical protein
MWVEPILNVTAPFNQAYKKDRPQQTVFKIKQD